MTAVKTVFLLIYSLCLFLPPSATGQPVLVTYPAPEGAEKAKDFRVWVNDQEISLYETVPAAVGIFSFSGPVQVRIAPTANVKWLDIRPKSLGIEHQIKDNQITFRLDKPCHLSIELHNESKRVLSLFANPPEKIVPSAKNKKVKFYKAGAIYEAGTIELKDGEELYIEGGALVKGNVLAANAKNIRISGRGILDGRQLERGVNLIALSRVEKAAIEGITLVGCKTWTVKPTFSRDLVIDNLKIVNWDTGSDGIDLVGTSYVRIQNCFVRANDDCIVIKTWGGDEKYPRHEQVGPDVEDIQVLNSVFWNMPWGNALEIGFELRASTIRDVLFKNCDIIHVERGAALSIHNGDYATVENIRYEDIRVEDARHKLIDLAVFLSQYSTDRPQDPEVRKSRYMNGAWDGVLWVLTGEEGNYAAKRGRIRNISFKNIRVVDSPSPFSVISGYDPQHRVENVTIDDLYINGKKVTSLAEGRIMVEQAEGVVVK